MTGTESGPKPETDPEPDPEPTDPPSALARTRRRGPTLQDAILDAAWDELAAVGYAQVTMAGVAARAGTNKATLYRRWPNRTELLVAAIDRRVVPLTASPPDTGSLRGDVIAVLQAMNRRSHAAQAIPDPGGELTAYLRHRAATEGFEQMDLVLTRARKRDQAKTLSAAVARLPVSVLHSQLCLGTSPVPDQAIAEIVDDLFLPLAKASPAQTQDR
ncbi:MAG TPA: TetR/AcrR family transcriptional regulator [Trebonia sp.]|nr:TetR/AcrR family transcriptional regulator [Trebonia sp.]